MELLRLIGIVIVIAGFLLGFNPMLVVLAAGIATGLAAHISPVTWRRSTPPWASCS